MKRIGGKSHRGLDVNRRIYTRLAGLERASLAASWARPWMDGSFTEELREALRAHEFELRETEGLPVPSLAPWGLPLRN